MDSLDLRLSQAGRSSTYVVHALLSAVNGRCDDSRPNGRGQDRPNRGQYASGATQVARPGRLHRRRTRQCRFRSWRGFTLTPRWCSRRSATRRSRSSDLVESLLAGIGAVVLPTPADLDNTSPAGPAAPGRCGFCCCVRRSSACASGVWTDFCAAGQRVTVQVAADQPTLKGGGSGRRPRPGALPFPAGRIPETVWQTRRPDLARGGR